MTLSVEKRLSIGLLICRISVALVFLAWGYDKLVKAGAGAGAMVFKDYYPLGGLSNGAIMVIGAAQLVMVALLLLGLFKRPVRGVLLVLTLVPFLLPSFWQGLYAGIFTVPHPTILFWSSTALCACAFAIYNLRDYDTMWTLGGSAKTVDVTSDKFRKDIGLSLFFCRLAVFLVFMVWVYSKIAWPERGVGRMRNFWLMPGFPEWGVSAFAWAELVVCFLFLFGYFKRLTGAFFVFLSIMAVFTPRALNGMKRVFDVGDESWHTILYYPGFCLLGAAVFVYLLRGIDRRFTLADRKG